MVYAAAGIDRKAGELILHASNPSNEAREVAINLRGWKSTKAAIGQVLTSASPDDRNTLDQPLNVAPKDVTVPVSGATLRHTLARMVPHGAARSEIRSPP